MPNKMERFSQQVRHVMSMAQQEAERLNHSHIGTEHLLIGLVCEENSIAKRVLEELGLDRHQITEIVERISPPTQRTPSSRLDLAADVKKTLELAIDEARRVGFHYIGTEHLLLGLVRTSDGKGVEALARLNVSPQEVDRQTRRVLQDTLADIRQPAADVSVKTATEINPEPVEKNESEPALRLAGTAQAAIVIALAEAKRMQHSSANTAHLLLGLLTDELDAAGRLLRTLGLDSDQVLKLVQQTPISQSGIPERSQFSPDAINALGIAVEESILAGNPYIRTEHLLLGLVRQKESPAIDILKQLNVSPEQVEKAVRGVMK